MSKLREWRVLKRVTQTRLAARVGATAATISRIEAGEQWPSPPLLTAIERTTKGAVTAADIVSDYQQAQRTRSKGTHAQAAE